MSRKLFTLTLVAVVLTALPLPAENFRRGDVNSDGDVGLLDGLALIAYFFNGGEAPGCLDAADADDDGVVSGLVDSIVILNYLFNSAATPPAPGPDECGPDPSDDDVRCDIEPTGCVVDWQHVARMCSR